MTQDQTEDQPNQLLVYGRPGCPMVPPVRTYLDEAGIAYTYRDIRQDADAAVQLRRLANGFESVPTVVLPNGRVLVEPGVGRLRQALKELHEAGGGSGDPGLPGTLKAGLSNPVYPVLLLIALALAVAIALASG
ncbi:MAG TPA: glutaredoxin family protein [Promineifilum sp.]|nr:glutaredoxin family protein [Promineifilum sp.]HQF70242.1 glutaredoxin family protein [Promineifilum sp.]